MESAVTDTLFIDNEDTFLDLIRDVVMRRTKQAVRVAASIPVAREQLREMRGGTVVCDWKLPGADGLAYLREVARSRPECRRVLLTGFAEEIDREKLEELRRNSVEVISKQDMSVDLLLELIGTPGVSRPETEEQDRGESPAHLIARQRLQIEVLEGRLRLTEELTARLAAGLVEELEHLAVADDLHIIMGGGPATKADLLHHVRQLTDDGIRLIELYHGAVARMIPRR